MYNKHLRHYTETDWFVDFSVPETSHLKVSSTVTISLPSNPQIPLPPCRSLYLYRIRLPQIILRNNPLRRLHKSFISKRNNPMRGCSFSFTVVFLHVLCPYLVSAAHNFESKFPGYRTCCIKNKPESNQFSLGID